jgi:hypothetical protein
VLIATYLINYRAPAALSQRVALVFSTEKAALARHSVRWAICDFVRQSSNPPTADSGPEWG